MPRLASVLVLVLLTSALAACASRRGGGGRGGTDAGPRPVADSGPMTMRDSGTIVLPDSGPLPDCRINSDCPSGFVCTSGRCERTTPANETNCTDMIDNDMDSRTDCADSDCAADPACRAVTCRSMPITEVRMPYCSAATQSCTDGCTTGACLESCLMADANPDCYNCAINNLLACYLRNGCQRQWDCFASCAEDRCPTGSPDTCVDTMCSSQLAAWDSCVMGVPASAMCGGTWTFCF